MLNTEARMRRRAAEMLVLATLFWGTSFPAMKAIAMIQRDVLPSGSSWFTASSMITVRFGLAALLSAVWTWRTLSRLTRSEVGQGLGLGLLAGLGMLFQMDGLAYTSASTSAFLTQSYCVFLPAIAAWRERRWPSGLLLACSLMAMTGVAVLSNVDWRSFRLGRGELETLISSIFFGGQILWLERPGFAGNRVLHFSSVMFAAMAVLALPLAMATMQTGRDWAIAFSPYSVLVLTGVLVVCCTLVAFVLMNRWQPYVPAAEAGLIYAAEPVFASLFALCMPAWLSAMAGIRYANEEATASLLVGGGLITLANVLIQLRPVVPVAKVRLAEKEAKPGPVFDSPTGQQ